MKNIVITFLLILFCINIFAQNNILGKYENYTGATEHFGTIIEVLPNGFTNFYSVQYHTSKKEKSGKWNVKADTLVLTWNDSIQKKYIIKNENLISEISRPPYDTLIDREVIKVYYTSASLVKTTNFYKNGDVESTRTWKSILDISPNLIPEGKWKYYYENGLLKAEGNFNKGKKKGLWKYYSLDGSLKTMKE